MHRITLFATAVIALTGPASAQAIDPSRPQMPMQWLLTIKPSRPELFDRKKWSDADNRLAQAHYKYLQGLAKSGALIFGGRTYDVDSAGRMLPDTVGEIVLQAKDRAEAEKLVNGDPAMKSRLFTAKLQSFAILVKL